MRVLGAQRVLEGDQQSLSYRKGPGLARRPGGLGDKGGGLGGVGSHSAVRGPEFAARLLPAASALPSPGLRALQQDATGRGHSEGPAGKWSWPSRFLGHSPLVVLPGPS